jgi:ribose 5-phosphate isomerase B
LPAAWLGNAIGRFALTNGRFSLHPQSKSILSTIPSGNPRTQPLKARNSIHLGQGLVAPVRIAIASDHAAFELKAMLAAHLREVGHDVIDLGPHNESSVDYPDYGYRLGAAIADGDADRGIALCGSGIGIAIAVNRNAACRCALVSEPLSAQLSRSHNDANVIAMGARLIGPEMAKACVDVFIATDFLAGRHTGRVDKLSHPNLAKEPA